MAAHASAPQRRLQARIARRVNPTVVRLAPYIPFYCVLDHRGRSSGRSFRTPLAAVRLADGFLLPLAFGERSNWVQNLTHAGFAGLEWRGRRFHVSKPRVLAWEEAAVSLNPVQRIFAPVFGARAFLRVEARPA